MPPVVVDNGEVIDGNHRYRAALKQNLSHIRAYVIGNNGSEINEYRDNQY